MADDIVTRHFTSSSAQTFYVDGDSISSLDPDTEAGFWLWMYHGAIDMIYALEQQLKTVRMELENCRER